MSNNEKKNFTLDNLIEIFTENDCIEKCLSKISKEKNDDTEIDKDVLLIEEVLRLGLDGKNEKEPFKPFMEYQGKRTLSLEDIKTEQYQVIENLIGKIKSHHVNARLADVLWAGCQDYPKVELALESYLSYIEDFVSSEEKRSKALIRDELKRCSSLLRLTKDKDTLKERLSNIFKILISPKDKEPSDFTRFIYFKIYAFANLEDDKNIIQMSENYADESKTQKHFRKYRDYLDICLKLHKKAKDVDKRDQTLNLICDSYFDEIKSIKEDGGNGLMLTDVCSRALYENMMAHKITRSRKEAIDDIHAELNNASLKSQDEMKSSPFDIDLSKPMEETFKAIEKLDTINGILALTYKTIPQEVEYYQNHAKEAVKGSLRHLFSTIHYDDNARIVDRDNGLSFENEDENASILLSEALFLFKNGVLIKGTCIDHGRNTLLLRHDITEYDFESFLTNNPFIPPNRISIIRKALWYGFIGKWEESMYLLVPQFENCFRHFLENVGVIVTLIDEDIVQQERTLSSLLHLPEFKKVFGEAHLFQIKALLSENKGFNFRNRLSHGLIGDDFYDSCSYFSPFVWGYFIYLSYMLRETFYEKLNQVKEI